MNTINTHYPDWVFEQTKKYINGKWVTTLSKKRMSLRMFLFDLKVVESAQKADEIIDFFKYTYRIDHVTNRIWNGLSKLRRRQLYVDKKGKCCYCDIPISFQEMTIEHIIPRACGGEDDEANFDIACTNCNNEKGAELATIINKINSLFPRNL